MQDRTVFFLGKLAGSNRRDAQAAAKAHGAKIAKKLDETVDFIVLGEAELYTSDWAAFSESLDEATREAFEAGRMQIVTESRFWEQYIEKLGPENGPPTYTAAMLAELIEVPVATIRLWYRRGFITAVRTVRNLPYFDYREVHTAKILRDLLKSGTSPDTIAKRIESLRRIVPDAERPLAQLALFVEGKSLLLRKDGILLDQRGQQRFDFELLDNAPESEELSALTTIVEPKDNLLEAIDAAFAPPPESLFEMAALLEEEGCFKEAIAMYRTLLLAGPPEAAVHFQLAELLYRQGDLTAARERYYMAIEIEEDYVEARANLGCVLAELGDLPLAIEAFRGALAFHPDYADVHFHLGIALRRIGKEPEGVMHLKIFRDLAPDSPWLDKVGEFPDE